MTLQSQLQGPSPSSRVQLFTVDATEIGGSVFRFSPTKAEGSTAATFGGVAYTGIPAEVSGFEWAGRDRNPRPKIKIPSFINIAAQAADLYEDLVGAKVTRQVTLREFLDDGNDPDATAIMRMDVYWISRFTSKNRLEIEWELRNATDVEGRRIPFRQVLPNTCTHTYRVPDGVGGFTLTNVTCPWGISDDDGDAYFDIENGSTTIGNDACPKTLLGCKTRYGVNSLPFRGFPGVGNIRR